MGGPCLALETWATRTLYQHPLSPTRQTQVSKSRPGPPASLAEQYGMERCKVKLSVERVAFLCGCLGRGAFRICQPTERTADPSTPLRSGQDDKLTGAAFLCGCLGRGARCICQPAGHTADPSTPLRSGQDDKVNGAWLSFAVAWGVGTFHSFATHSFVSGPGLSLEIYQREGHTADPSTPVRSGQDDKLTGVAFLRGCLGRETFACVSPQGALQILPLRFAPVRMTK